MKKWLYALSVGLVLSHVAFVQAENKIAVVNISSIFQQFPERAIVTKQLENEFKGRDIELQSMRQDLQTKIQHLQRDGSLMKPRERSELEKSIITQRETFSNKAQAFEQDNRRRQMEERNKILNRIQEAVKNVAAKKGYDIVLDANAIAYANHTKEITSDVLKQVK